LKKILRNIFILLLPIALIIVINEIMRPTIKEKPYFVGKTVGINSVKGLKDKCSWICHNNTSYCKKNHVKYLKPYFNQVDPFYFGIIGGLQKTGEYVFSNIIILGVIIPLWIYYFFIRILDLRSEIKALKK